MDMDLNNDVNQITFSLCTFHFLYYNSVYSYIIITVKTQKERVVQ